jgi:hypothetical protein
MGSDNGAAQSLDLSTVAGAVATLRTAAGPRQVDVMEVVVDGDTEKPLFDM